MLGVRVREEKERKEGGFVHAEGYTRLVSGLSAHRLCPVWLQHSPKCLWRLAPDDTGRRALLTLLRNKWNEGRR